MNPLLGHPDNALSILKDPFASEHIQSVRLMMFRGYQGIVTYYAVVEFQNGETKGEQRINGTSFNELIQKTETFIQTLKK